MTTYVDYMYRAPGSSEDVRIRSEKWPDKFPQDVLPLIESVGKLTDEIPSNGPGDNGEGAKRYKVIEIDAAPQRGDDPRPVENLVVVVVTDPD